MFDAGYIDNELQKIGARARKRMDIYLIGGCAMSFRNLKESTKDIDIVFANKEDYEEFCETLSWAQYFEKVKNSTEYIPLYANKMVENKDGFHLDLFVVKVCGKLNLSKGMISRAEKFRQYGNITVHLISKEDIFLFKSLASEGRKRDLDDMRVIYPNLDWNIIFEELVSQKLEDGDIIHIIKRLKEFNAKFELDVPLISKLRKMVK